MPIFFPCDEETTQKKQGRNKLANYQNQNFRNNSKLAPTPYIKTKGAGTNYDMLLALKLEQNSKLLLLESKDEKSKIFAKIKTLSKYDFLSTMYISSNAFTGGDFNIF